MKIAQPTEDFEGLVRRAVARFVQSAVVVDDRAVMGVSQVPTTLVTPPEGAEIAAVVEGAEEIDDLTGGVEIDDPANTQLDAKAIVDAFASRGVVCAVLRPEPGEVDELTRVAPPAISRSDLLILDWHLQSDDGDAAIALLKEVLDTAEEALRLVAIYTGEPKRDAIVRRLIQDLGAEQIDELSVHAGAVRIVVLAKAVEDEGPEDAVSERELPEAMLRHFANLADGLVRAAALTALGALRGATYRLLAGLDHAIDVGYIGHRTLVFPTSEAENDLLGMLIADLRAIVEDDADTRNCTGAEAVALWLEHEAASGRGSAVPPAALAAAIETDLFDRSGAPLNALKLKHPELKGVKPRQNEGLTELFTPDVETAKNADERFAMRMTLKQVYDHPERYLSLGTIVRSQDESYWLCVQPVCDSLRITGRRRYPFVPLNVVDSKFHYVVEDDGHIIRLRLSRSLADMKHWTFEADAAGRAVLAKGNPPAFANTSGARFRWIAQLNEGHAQRVAHELGVEQSRVGLSESDWLRRMSK
jgi:hypothetical protein